MGPRCHMWDYKGLVPSSSLEPQQLCLHRHFQLLVGHWVGLGEMAGGLCLLEKLWYLCHSGALCDCHLL